MSRLWEKYDDPDTPLSERHDPNDIKDAPITEEQIQAIKDAQERTNLIEALQWLAGAVRAECPISSNSRMELKRALAGADAMIERRHEMTEFSNQLSPAEAERLALLIERAKR